MALKDFGNKVADITKILQGLKINHQEKKIFYTGIWKKIPDGQYHLLQI